MPIKFEIYRDGNRVNQYVPVGAMAIGPESVPINGDVSFRDGLLICTRSEEHPVGVSLLWELGPLGTYEMETTRLPPREKPYNLNVELARFRLMKIVQKQEDWNLFDFPRAERFADRFKESQNLFGQSLGKLDEPGEASLLADRSLQISVDLSEELAVFHGELLLHRRRSAGGLSKHIFGCRVDSTVQNQKYKETLADNFDHAVLPMSWKQLQPEQDRFDTAALDDWVEMLAKKRVPIIAGPLIDLSEAGVPDWMFIWEHDFDTLRELAYEFVQKIVGRYRKQVSVWNLVAGLHTNSAFTLSFEQSIELTRLLVSQVKSSLPSAKTLVTITQPYGEYNARGTTSVPPMFYAEMVAQAGINFDAFGLEMETGVPTPGGYTRDLFQVSCMLDRFSTIGRPVFLTSVSAPGRATPDPSDRSEGKLDPSAAGRWRKPWDAEVQAEWIDAVYRLALSKPYVESIAWGNLADITPTVPAGGLLDDMLKPKPAFAKIQELRDGFQRKKALMQLSAPQGWTSGQRVALLAIIAGLFLYLTLRYFANPTFVSDPQPVEPPRAQELVDRIDPNTADVATLAAMPQLGLKRAQTIIDYREARRRSRPDVVVFERAEDLMRIKGIGPATLDQIRPYLAFPTTRPSTQAIGSRD